MATRNRTGGGNGPSNDARERLLARKRTLLASVEGHARDEDDLEEDLDDPERGESALRARTLEELSRFEDAERQQLEEIEHALAKIAAGEYGRCERCRHEIPEQRLAAVPEARYCVRCEHLAEREAETGSRQSAEGATHEPPVPPEYADLEPGEIEAAVREELAESGGLEGVEAVWRNGKVWLSGEVPEEEHREIARQIVSDRMGLPVEERIRVSESLRESPPGAHFADGDDDGAPATDEERALGRAEGREVPVTDTVLAEDEGLPLTPGDAPMPEPRKE